jgi:hypothetical protein
MLLAMSRFFYALMFASSLGWWLTAQSNPRSLFVMALCAAFGGIAVVTFIEGLRIALPARGEA